MNKYLYFLLKIGLLVVLVGALDFFIGSALRHYYFKQTSGKQYRTTVSMEQTKADIIILGSSRANHHYVPSVFEKTFNQTVYNAGRDAEYIFYHYAVLKAILKRYRPKLVVLEFQRRELIENPESYDKIASLLPYYSAHPEIREIANLKSRYERIKLLSKIYPFNSSILSIAAGTGKLGKSKEIDQNGYVPLNTRWSKPLMSEEVKGSLKVDPVKLSVYRSFLDDCLSKNVKVVVVCSPYYKKFASTDESLELAKNLAKSKGVAFYDFSTDPYFLARPDLFGDPLHLNHKGALIFSEKLVKLIAPRL